MKKSTLRRADLVFSVVLMIVSAYFLVKSVALFYNPFGRPLQDINAEEIKLGIIEWYKSPGLLPFILSAVLFMLAICLLHVAKKDGAKFDFLTKKHISDFLKNRELKVVIIVVGLLMIYIYGIIPTCRKNLNLFPSFQGFPFMIATFIYLTIFMIFFNKKTVKDISLSVLIAALSSAAITYGFGNLAMIPLP